jgi:uncharacterized protein YjiS (DUF1127 family)
MTTADLAPVDHSAQFSLVRGIHAVGRWVAARRSARAKREALLSPLFAPEHRLRDIGVTREQPVQAIETQGRAARDQFQR